MMEYGKAAYLKALDLEARVDGLGRTVRESAAGCVTVADQPEYYTVEQRLPEIVLEAARNTAATVSLRLVLTGGEAGFDCSVSMSMAGVEFYSVELPVESGKQSYLFTGVCGGALAGENRLEVVVTFSALGVKLHSYELQVQGMGLTEKEIPTEMCAFGSEYGQMFLYGDERKLYLIQQNPQSERLTAAYLELPGAGEIAVCTPYEAGKPVPVLFRRTGKESRGGILNLLTGAESGAVELPGGIAALDACTTAEGIGVLGYLRLGKIYLLRAEVAGGQLTLGEAVPLKENTFCTDFSLVGAPGGCYLLTSTAGTLRARKIALTASGFSEPENLGSLGNGQRPRGYADADGVRFYYCQGGAVLERELDGQLSQERTVCFARERLECENYYLDRTSDRLKLVRKQPE